MASTAAVQDGWMARAALRSAAWAEKWFPDSWVFAVVGIFIVVLAAFAIGAPAAETSKAFGKGFWSLIPFTMQMAFVVIGGYVVASSKYRWMIPFAIVLGVIVVIVAVVCMKYRNLQKTHIL